MPPWTLEPIVLLGLAATAEEALEAMAQGTARYAAIGLDREVHAVVSTEQVTSLANDPQSLLPRVGGRSGVVVLEDADDASAETVAVLSRALLQSGAVAVIVLGPDGALEGALPRAQVAAAVSAASLSGRTRMYGRPDVPVYAFVCRQCEPPSYRLPRAFDDMPRCPRDFRHGAMVPDS